MRKCVLLGAGFSYDLGMPLSDELTRIILDPIDDTGAQGICNILSTQEPYGKDSPLDKSAVRECIDMLLRYVKTKNWKHVQKEAAREIQGLRQAAHEDARNQVRQLNALLTRFAKQSRS